MSRIFEIFGRELSETSEIAKENLKEAICPFSDSECDGGGNRYSTHINLAKTPSLQPVFPNKEIVPSGICSLQLKEGDNPWIVCPRRLLVFGKSGDAEVSKFQSKVSTFLYIQSGLKSGTRIGVWPEVKLKYSKSAKSFDYTFDYVLMPISAVSLEQAIESLGLTEKQTLNILSSNGYEVSNNQIADFPTGAPIIVEIMTSSTSGGNKAKRTTIGSSENLGGGVF